MISGRDFADAIRRVAVTLLRRRLRTKFPIFAAVILLLLLRFLEFRLREKQTMMGRHCSSPKIGQRGRLSTLIPSKKCRKR